MDIALIQAAYPHPQCMAVDTDYRDRACYCVGGAVAAYYGLLDDAAVDTFPDLDQLAALYRHINPLLPPGQASDLAGWTIAHNDASQFDLAWRDAESAINFVPQER